MINPSLQSHSCMKRCESLNYREKCPECALTFTWNWTMRCHVRQQHSKNPLRFPCMICGHELSRRHNLQSEEKPHFSCWYCNATFSRKTDKQEHMRRRHGRICREKEVDLHLHLQHLSEEKDFQNEWQFVESRLTHQGEHNVCPCGQTSIQSFFFI